MQVRRRQANHRDLGQMGRAIALPFERRLLRVDIDQEHRLVYTVDGDALVVLQARYHY